MNDDDMEEGEDDYLENDMEVDGVAGVEPIKPTVPVESEPSKCAESNEVEATPTSNDLFEPEPGTNAEPNRVEATTYANPVEPEASKQAAPFETRRRGKRRRWIRIRRRRERRRRRLLTLLIFSAYVVWLIPF